MKRRYRRYFIILELEDRNYKAYANKEVKGHAKIEIKNSSGTLSIQCQNLKSSSNGNRYRWYLINTNTEGAPIIVEVGPMEVDEKGKGEIICQFNTDNVKGSAEAIDNFNVLVLVVQNKEDKSQIYTPLVGYMDKDKPDANTWRYALGKYLYVPVGQEIVQEEFMAEEGVQEEFMPEETEVDPIESDKGPEARDQAVEIEEETGAKDQVIEEDVRAEDQAIETEEVKAEDQTVGIEEVEVEDEVKDQVKVEDEVKDQVKVKDEVDAEQNEYEEQMQAYIENSLKGFNRVEPFADGFDHYVWWQIPYNDQTMYRSYMPFILYLDSLKEPTNYYVSKMLQIIYVHKHHIFGICYDVNNKAKYYAYGIPGRNISVEGSFDASVDIAQWHPCNNLAINAGSHGYSILLIDAKTGEML